jgi:molybdopterin biosynthesis enzyme MoaB
MTVRIAVLTVSDRASRGEYEDLGGAGGQGLA